MTNKEVLKKIEEAKKEIAEVHASLAQAEKDGVLNNVLSNIRKEEDDRKKRIKTMLIDRAESEVASFPSAQGVMLDKYEIDELFEAVDYMRSNPKNTIGFSFDVSGYCEDGYCYPESVSLIHHYSKLVKLSDEKLDKFAIAIVKDELRKAMGGGLYSPDIPCKVFETFLSGKIDFDTLTELTLGTCKS